MDPQAQQLVTNASAGEAIVAKIQRQATPVWSMELLLSGGLVFAMFESMRWADGFAMPFMNHLSGVDVSTVAMLYTYLVGAFAAIFATFAVHLMLRTVWVELIGVMSVYPNGIRWDQTFASKKSAEVARARLADPVAIIDALDNRCTLVFAGGILISSFLVGSLIIVSALGVVAWLLHAWVFPKLSTFELLVISFAILYSPYMLLALADSVVSALSPNASILKHTGRASAALNNMLVAKPTALLSAMITTNLGRTRGMVLMAVVPSLVAVIIASRVVGSQSGYGPFDVNRQLERFADQAMHANTYANTRERDSAMPYIDGIRSSSAYLKLRIPYHARNMDGAIAKACPDQSNADFKATQGCLAKLLNIKLNGTAVNANIQILQDGERLELLQMMDVRTLGNGEHVVSATSLGRERKDDKIVHIKFWR
jgi:hypothetical protein